MAVSWYNFLSSAPKAQKEVVTTTVTIDAEWLSDKTPSPKAVQPALPEPIKAIATQYMNFKKVLIFSSLLILLVITLILSRIFLKGNL